MTTLFDSPNDIHWQGHFKQYQRSGTQLFIGKVLDERGDGNFTDNLTQRYTVELIGWTTKLYNCKVIVEYAGYNGTGNYRNFRVGDIVIVQAKEGQLDESFIIGGVRLNGDFNIYEEIGKNQVYGEHYTGPSGNVAPSNPPSYHPSRVTKIDSELFIGGINNLQEPFQDPTQLGTLKESLQRQYLPGILKGYTKEGVGVNYACGGVVNLTDGHFTVLAAGLKISKCSKLLEQAKRHLQISNHLKGLSSFTSDNIVDSETFLLNVDFTNAELSLAQAEIPEFQATSLDSFDPNQAFTIGETTPLFNIETAQPITNSEDVELTGDEEKSVATSDNVNDADIVEEERINIEAEEINTGNTALTIRSAAFRSKQHEDLATLAKDEAEKCNSENAGFQYAAFALGGAAIANESDSNVSPNQFNGQVDSNNYAGRSNGQDPKPPVTFKPAHPSNYTQRTHTPKYLIMHNSEETFESMTELFQRPNYKAAAHYGVGRDGSIVQYVKDSQIAWHTRGHNTGKIGIKIVAGTKFPGMTKPQEESLIKLARYIVGVYNIPLENVRGHNEFNNTDCPKYAFSTKANLRQWVNTYLR